VIKPKRGPGRPRKVPRPLTSFSTASEREQMTPASEPVEETGGDDIAEETRTEREEE
jgi:hypothetical protein